MNSDVSLGGPWERAEKRLGVQATFKRSSSTMYLKVHIFLLLIALGAIAVQGKLMRRLHHQSRRLRPDSKPLGRFDEPREF